MLEPHAQWQLPQGGIPFPQELIHIILEDIILENIHYHLTLECEKKPSWNSLNTLSQVCHSFRSNALHICEQLLGEPTVEQIEGSWHEKSAVQHVCEVVEHLFRFSPYSVSCTPVEDLNSCTKALLNPEYRAAVQLPGLFGLYDTWNILRIIRVSTFRWGSILERRSLEFAVLGAGSRLISKVIAGFYFQRLKYPQLAFELVLESVKNFHGIICWIIAGKFEVMNTLTSPLANPQVSDIVADAFSTLAHSERITLRVWKNMTASKFHSLVGPVVSASGLISQLERFVENGAGDPFNVKPKVEQYLADWLPYLQNHTNTLV